MMKRVLLIFICTILFVGCSKDEENDNSRQLLIDKYNGRYELISSVSDDAVDLNNDGIASTDLITENCMISLSIVQIRFFTRDEMFSNDQDLYFDESWPQENAHRVRMAEPITTTQPPILNSYYDSCHDGGVCRFNDDDQSIDLTQDVDKSWGTTLLSMESIVFEENETIKVTAIRKLYTMNGWVSTKIISRYKRYTLFT